MGDTKLLPCPFCGGEAVSENYVIEAAAFCKQCRAKIIRSHGARDDNGLPEAIAAWNTRPALLAAAKYEEANPLGGPATMLEAAARRIRAGEDFHEVLADYALLARQEGEGWLPIESAPKKGRVMLYDADRIPSILIAHWRHGAWWGDMTNSGRSIVWRDATHWRTLPAPPAARSGGGG